MAATPPQQEVALAIERLEATRRRLLTERTSLLEKLETLDTTLRQLDARLAQYRRDLAGAVGT